MDIDIKAFKMDGLGNDFVIIDQRSNIIDLNKDQIIKICDRNFIGCDQLILIKKNRKIDAGLEFYNADGSSSDACGNGTRCVAYFLYKENNKEEIKLWTSSKIIKSKILSNKIVVSELGVAKTKWDEIPINQNLDTINLNIKIFDKNNNEFIGGTAVNVGNPHVIFCVKNLEDFDIEKIGPDIEKHNLFPEKCNVTIAQVINKNLVKVKVWERGVGLTKACGTAACATAVASKINGLTESNTDIEFDLGKLSIFIDKNDNIHMKGPVSDIQEIRIKL
jgi:diaminopimelate epimerase